MFATAITAGLLGSEEDIGDLLPQPLDTLLTRAFIINVRQTRRLKDTLLPDTLLQYTHAHIC